MDDHTKISIVQKEVAKNQVSLESIETRLKDLEKRALELEEFKEASVENQCRLDAIVSKLRNKMNEQTYMLHKLRVEQYATKKNIKQMDFSISQLPYLLVDELHEQDLQKHYLILRDCTSYKGFPSKNGQPDFKTFAIKVIREIWEKFDGRKLVHCEFIKPNAWEKKQVPTRFRLKLKFSDQITPMTIRNIAISKQVYRYRMGQTKRRRNYRYKRVQEAEEKNKVLPKDSTWEYRVVQGTRIAKVDKKSGDFLQGQFLDEQSENNFESNRVKDFRLNIQLYEGINPNIKPKENRSEDSEDDDDYSKMDTDTEDHEMESVIQVFTDEFSQKQNETSFKFDPLIHQIPDTTMNGSSEETLSSNDSTIVNSMRNRELLVDPTQEDFTSINGAVSTPSHFPKTSSQDSGDSSSSSSGYSSLKSVESNSQEFSSQDSQQSQKKAEDSVEIELESTPAPAPAKKTKRTRRSTEMEKKMEKISKFGFTTASSQEDVNKDKKTSKKRKLEVSKNETIQEPKISKEKPKSKPPQSKLQKTDTSESNTDHGFDPSSFVPSTGLRRSSRSNQGNLKGPQTGADAKNATKTIVEKVTKGPNSKETKAIKQKK